jgi:AcrR family transcriptional regulator
MATLKQSRKSVRAAKAAEHPALQQRSQDKRDRLIKAGIRVFARDGYEGARVVDIAKEAGISVGVFYQRFTDKRGFFTVLEQEFIDRARTNLDRFYATADESWTANDYLERFIQRQANIVYRNVGFFRALVTLAHKDKSVIDPAIALDRYSAEKALEYMLRRGFVKPGALDVDTVYFGLSSIGRVLALMALNDVGPYRANDPATARELTRMLAGYLGIR